jgi:4-amino-4-deoxy-L-arabinose transferase-like glycosyltransferase
MKLHEQGDGERTNHSSHQRQAWMSPTGSRRRILILVLIFFTALGVRFLNWHAHRSEVSKVQTNVTLNYKHLARLIQENGFVSLYNASSATSNSDLLGHPPGYPIVLAMIYKFAPESDTAAQIFQMILDSLCALIISLIAWELMPAAVAVIAGLMAAFAPQFSWNSLLLLPDSLAALPILLAVYFIIKTRNKPRLLYLLTAGSLIGLSCWLRANALLLAPFMALVFPFIFKRGQRSPAILAFIGGACLLIAPLTIRNAVVFGKFIPVSLGAGQTLIEGLADYNTDGSLGLPQTDIELIRQEAEAANRSDYASSLFSPDGIARDRARMTRGLTVIRAHPIWFFGVMIRRATSMLRLERTPLRLATAEFAGSLNLFQSLLRGLQKLFMTAIILPFVLIGAGLMLYKRQIQTLAILLVVPFYYFCIQSALHTEYRYVLVIHYFLFVLAAFALFTIGSKISQKLRAKPV